eukprot:TRINITY_DN60179_c1_g3_i1.p1 TRINITY_DN60179_c1_g3~~TRINITY_DN60179_c1_g3_i1.p1  ORF type:complete len:511 (-),score=43.47 TRINITY_DN60179_c1_g3_i1:71-1552(-)
MQVTVQVQEGRVCWAFALLVGAAIVAVVLFSYNPTPPYVIPTPCTTAGDNSRQNNMAGSAYAGSMHSTLSSPNHQHDAGRSGDMVSSSHYCTIDDIREGSWVEVEDQWHTWDNISHLAQLTGHQCLLDPSLNRYRYQCAKPPGSKGFDAKHQNAEDYQFNQATVQRAWRWDWQPTNRNCTLKWKVRSRDETYKDYKIGSMNSMATAPDSLLVQQFVSWLGTSKLVFLGDSVLQQAYWEVLCLVYKWLDIVPDMQEAHRDSNFIATLRTGGKLMLCHWYGIVDDENHGFSNLDDIDVWASSCVRGADWIIANSGPHWAIQMHAAETEIAPRWAEVMSTMVNSPTLKGLLVLPFHNPVSCHGYKQPITKEKYEHKKLELTTTQHPYQWQFNVKVAALYNNVTNAVLGSPGTSEAGVHWLQSHMLDVRVDALTQRHTKAYDCIHFCSPSFPLQLRALIFMQSWVEGRYKHLEPTAPSSTVQCGCYLSEQCGTCLAA